MTATSPQRTSSIIGGEGQRQVKLPFSKAFAIAMQSIRVRFWRSMITAAGVLLGIALLASTHMQPTLAKTSVKMTADAEQNAQATRESDARRQWLIALSLMVSTVGIA